LDKKYYFIEQNYLKKKIFEMASSSLSFLATLGKPAPIAIKETPSVIILTGQPGCGKSHLCSKLPVDKFKIDRQDGTGMDFRTYIHHLNTNIFTLKKSKHIVIDRCNHLKRQRELLVNAAHHHGWRVIIVSFEIPDDVRIQRMQQRLKTKEPHPSIKTQQNLEDSYNNFLKTFEPFNADEWWDTISFIISDDISLEKTVEKLTSY